MFPLALLNKSEQGLTTVLNLEFNGADGSTIIDSTGRHSPSLSVSGTRGIVSNKLELGGGGFIRADAQNVASADFDFSTGDWSVECDAFVTSDGAYFWNKSDVDGTLGLALRLPFNSSRIMLQNSVAASILLYDSPTSLLNTQLNLKVQCIAGRVALSINNTEVVSSTSSLGSIGGNGMIIGNSGSGSSALAITIDNFIVRKS